MLSVAKLALLDIRSDGRRGGLSPNDELTSSGTEGGRVGGGTSTGKETGSLLGEDVPWRHAGGRMSYTSYSRPFTVRRAECWRVVRVRASATEAKLLLGEE